MSVSSSHNQPTPALHAGSSDTVDLRHHRGGMRAPADGLLLAVFVSLWRRASLGGAAGSWGRGSARPVGALDGGRINGALRALGRPESF